MISTTLHGREPATSFVRRSGLPAMVLVAIWGAVAAGEGNERQSKIPVGRATTFLEGPLDAEGYVDYGAALNAEHGRGVTPETNACVLFWDAVGAEADPTYATAAYFQALGREVPPKEGRYFVSLDDYLTDHPEIKAPAAEVDKWFRLSSTPWRGFEHPIVFEWLASNEIPLRVIAEASKRPHYYSPIVAGNDVMNLKLPGAQAWDEVFDALKVRAMLAVGEGRTAEACSDLLVAITLARLVDRSAPPMAENLYYTWEWIVTWSLRGVVTQERPAENDLRALLDALDRRPPRRPPWERCLNSERLSHLDFLQRLARGDEAALDRHPETRLPREWGLKPDDYKRMDFTAALGEANRRYDEIAESYRRMARTERNAAVFEMDKKNREAAKLYAEGGTLFGMKTWKWTPSSPLEISNVIFQERIFRIGLSMTNGDYLEVNGSLLRTTIGLEIHRAKYGAYPDRLSELGRRLILAPPVDPYSGSPLLYVRIQDGFLLYSVGPNEIDEGGRDHGDWRQLSDDERTNIPTWDDIRIRLPPDRQELRP
jgi:hypothetical protein